MRWGGRNTGTPFAMPYRALVPEAIDGLLACDKNASVSHIANGATRLQPVVLGLGQAAGMAAAMCVERGCQPRDLDVRSLQAALVSDPIAPAAVVPLFDRQPRSPDWVATQLAYCDRPEAYPRDGYAGGDAAALPAISTDGASELRGKFERRGENDYRFRDAIGTCWRLVTLTTAIDRQLRELPTGEFRGRGYFNRGGGWIRLVAIG